MESENEDGGHVVGVLEPFLVSMGLALAVSFRFFQPIWQVAPGLVALGLLTGVAYLAGYVWHRRSQRRGFRTAVLVTIVVSQPLLIGLFLLGLPVSRSFLVVELVLLFFGVAAAGLRGPASLRVLLAGGFASAAALPTGLGLVKVDEDRAPAGPREAYLFTNYHDVSVTTYEVMPGDPQDGGALTRLPDGRVLLVAGSGAARLLEFRDGLDSSPIELGLPIDVEAYRALGRPAPQYYRVVGAVYDEGHLFVSYTHWDSAEDCYALRLVEAQFDGSTAGPWVTRFESRPCLALPAMNIASGGRIAVLDSASLLLSIGTFGIYDDRLSKEGYDYGKILKLDRATWHPEVFTAGHRNPAGLLVAGDRIWSTEHGPQGGDELNLIEAGSDYGWPIVSYGTDYGMKTLASGRDPGDHSGFAAPVYAWVPSVGISNLIRASGASFPEWRGDLLIGSIRGLGHGWSLFRVRLLEERAVSVERIPISSVVRDLVELPAGGPLILWDGRGIVRVLRPADHVFSACAACHGVRDGGAHGIGPDLFGIVGSPVSRHGDYVYSAALRRYGGTWTPARLDRFLENPGLEVPGTSMEFEGVGDPAERAEIIQFLREIRGGRAY